MDRRRIIWALALACGAMVLAAGSYWFGVRSQQAAENANLAYVQAALAFGHYKAGENLESLLVRKCFDAALAEIRQAKNMELMLLSENFQAAGRDPELAEYIRTRDANVLELVTAGRIPEMKPYTTRCP
jgi:hypothetical protein